VYRTFDMLLVDRDDLACSRKLCANIPILPLALVLVDSSVVQVSPNCRYPTIGKVSVGLHACETVRSQNEVTLLRWAPVEK